MSAAANERRSRLRDQMKEFYGDPSAGKASASSTNRANASGVPPEMDLDSEYFSVPKYTTDLLRRESLKGLVEADTQLLRSVRRLDHELQELVYQNYAKFISATDTIRDMNSNVSEMDAKLEALASNVTQVDTLSRNVDDQLKEHRGKIEETITANRRLKKIQFLVGLPATMQQLIDKESYHVCVKYWVAGDGFLSQHVSIPSIASIQARCRDLSRELYARIEKAMCSYPLDDPEAMEVIRRHVEDLRLLRATSLFESGAAQQPQGAFEEAVLRTLLQGVKANFQNGVAAAKRGIATALAVPPHYGAADYGTLVEPLTKSDLREVLAQFKGACALLLLNTEKVHALLNQLDDRSAAQVSQRVADEMQPALMSILTPITDHLIELASTVMRAVGAQGGALVVAGDVSLVKDTVDAAVDALCKQLRNIASTMRSLGTLYLEAAKGQQARAYSALVDRTVCGVLQGCAEDLERMSLQQPHDGAMERVMAASRTRALVASLPDVVRRQVAERAFAMSRYVMGGIATTLMSGVTHTLSNNPDVVAAPSVTPALKALEKAGLALHDRFVVLQGQIELEAVLEGGVCNEKSAVDPIEETPARGGGVPACLLALSAEWETTQEWLTPLSPPQPTTNAARNATSAAANRQGAGAGPGGAAGGGGLYSTASAATDSSYHYRLGSAGGGGGGVSGGSRGGASGALGTASHRPYVSFTRRENAGLQSTVNRILTQQVSVWSTKPVDGQVASTMRGVIFYLLKGLTDHVRLRVSSMDTNSFHRLQISATYLLRALLTPQKRTAVRAWAKTWDDAVQRQMQQQLDELCASGYERYEAKVPLANNVIDKVLDEAERAVAATLADDGAQQPAMSPLLSAGGGFTSNQSLNASSLEADSLGASHTTSSAPASAVSGARQYTADNPNSTPATTTTTVVAPAVAPASAATSNPLGGSGAGTVGPIATSSASHLTSTASSSSSPSTVAAKAPTPVPVAPAPAPTPKPTPAPAAAAPAPAPAPAPLPAARPSVFAQGAAPSSRDDDRRHNLDEDEELLL